MSDDLRALKKSIRRFCLHFWAAPVDEYGWLCLDCGTVFNEGKR